MSLWKKETMYKFKLTIPAQEIPAELKNGTEVVLQGSAAVESQVVKDSHSDEPDITSVLKAIWIEVRPSDSPIQAPIFKGEIKHKSMSQRVRDLLYRLHIERGGKEADFEAFYNERMTDYCEKIQDKIDQEKGLV